MQRDMSYLADTTPVLNFTTVPLCWGVQAPSMAQDMGKALQLPSHHIVEMD